MEKTLHESHFRRNLLIISAAALLIRILCALPALIEGNECLLRFDIAEGIDPEQARIALKQGGQSTQDADQQGRCRDDQQISLKMTFLKRFFHK